MKRDTLNDILQEFTCRICLFRHKENSEISGTLSTFAEYISKHLDFEVVWEEDSPIWICKFCQQSLQSFHSFYSKVSQIQESLANLISAIKGTPSTLDETPKLDAEFEVIDLTVGFGRGKPHPPVKIPSETSPQRVSTRIKTKSTRTIDASTEGTVDLSKRKKEKQPKEIVAHAGCNNTSNDCSVIESDSVASAHDAKDVVTLDTAGISECRLKSEKSTSSINEDLSSLEDQDWMDQNPDFDSDDSCNDDWKPPSKCKRRKPYEQSVKRISNELETCDSKSILDEEVENLEAKKPKLKITATHGTEPKPKLPPDVKRILREEINAKFVEFYGISCDICMKNIRENSLPIEPVKYDSFAALCDHMKADHNVRGYVKCCNSTMREKKRAERHMLLHTEPGSIFKCNICGKQLSTQQSFRSHILLHLPDNERPFQCSHCDRGFATKPDLTHHERQHLPEDKRLMFTCDICGSRFGYENGLLLHKQRVHGDSRPHLCDICAKSFKSRSDMERHKAQTHGDVKREQCQECGKWFKGKGILKTHMRQHMGAKFQCEHCDKTYTVRSSWKAHMLTHSDEKRHKCPVCHKLFKLPGTLKMHLNQHTGEHPYSCPFCPKKFASSGNYYTHRKRMHSSEIALLKKNTEAALANGLPPPSLAPRVPTQSLSQAIELTKEKVAAKAATVSLVNENIASLNPDHVEDSDQVPTSASILTEKSVLTNTLIMSPSVTTGEGSDYLIVPNGIRLVRILSPEGTTKYGFARKTQETLDLPQQSLLLTGTGITQVDTDITQENNDPVANMMPSSVS